MLNFLHKKKKEQDVESNIILKQYNKGTVTVFRNREMKLDGKTSEVQEVVTEINKDEIEHLPSLLKSKKIIDYHFSLMQEHERYYADRKTNPNGIEKCKLICLKDIDLLDQLNQAYKIWERHEIEKAIQLNNRLKIHMKPVDGVPTHEEQLINLGKYGFRGEIIAFKRLAIIYEKEEDYYKALEISNKAIEYYRDKNCDKEYQSFINRRNRLVKKIGNKKL